MRITFQSGIAPQVWTGAEGFMVADATTEIDSGGSLRRVVQAPPWTLARLHVTHDEDEGSIGAVPREFVCLYSVDDGVTWDELCASVWTERIIPGTDVDEWTEVPEGWPTTGDVLVTLAMRLGVGDIERNPWNMFAIELELSS